MRLGVLQVRLVEEGVGGIQVQEARAARILESAEKLIADKQLLRAESMLQRAASKYGASESGKKAGERAKELKEGDFKAEYEAQQALAKLVGGVEKPAEADSDKAMKRAKDLEKKAEEWKTSAPRAAQIGLLRAHPELGGREAQAGTMTRDSTTEQGRLGLDALERAELDRLTALNRAYRERFGFPCIIALRKHATRASVYAAFEQRLGNDADAEVAHALEEVASITRGRLEKVAAAAP